jgi:hypothetical protein
MKNYILPLIALIFITTEVFGGTDSTGITIHLAVQTNSVAWDTTHTSASFMCRAIIDNKTDDSLTLTNLFQDHSGLSLKVTDQDGTELSRLYSAPFQRESFTIAARTKASFWPYYGIMNHFSLPKGHTTVRIQLDGKLIGSSYGESVTSNIVMLNVP